MISEEEGRRCGFGEYEVCVISNVFVTLKDGTRLGVRLWCPRESAGEAWFSPGEASTLLYTLAKPRGDQGGEQYPVVMEYIPYPKSVFTAERDYRRHVWLASHGYVCARVDMRGAGDSDGLYYDEYLQQEQDDACEIIQWFADQTWCNGKVGMYGKSWGGFNGLQVAWERPPALKAVISIYSTDDRYNTDMHYEGGCILASGMLSWASRMMLFNCLPPNPKHREDWEQVWRERLEKASDPWATKWLSHQSRDEYWMQASVCKDYSRLEGCNILAIGGWADGYFNTVFRLAENVSTVKGIVGPWSHQWPDTSLPGPTMEFMKECLNWWDCHLKGIDNGADSLPKMRIYNQEGCKLTPAIPRDTPGHWLALPSWPYPKTQSVTMYPSTSGFLADMANGEGVWQQIHFHAGCGTTSCGEWLNWSVEGEGPYNQRIDDSYSRTWDTDKLSDPLTILGRPELTLTFRVSNTASSQVCVRLCDVSDDGQSRYITRGLKNLNRLKGNGPGEQEVLEPGKVYTVSIPLSNAGYTIAKGNRLRLAVSASYFPIAWPAKNATPIEIMLGEDSFTSLTLPTVSIDDDIKLDSKLEDHMICHDPKLGPPFPMDEIRPSSGYKVVTTHDQVKGVYKRHMLLDSGCNKFLDSSITCDNIFSAEEISEITEGDPESAKFVVKSDITLTWPTTGTDSLDTKIVLYSEMKCQGGNFLVINDVKVVKDEEEYFTRIWQDEVKRDLI